MAIVVSPSQTAIYTVLRAFLLSALPSGTPVIRGQVNRVPEPANSDFAVMWVTSRVRLATNEDTDADALFAGSISGTTLTISVVHYGELVVGAEIFGEDVADGTVVTALGSGTGGVGTYVVSQSQTVASQPIAAGQANKMQRTQVLVQIDVHGPNSDDNVQAITTLFRDPYGVDFMSALNPNMAPLYADDPRQIPFTNAEQQIETKYVVEAFLQANQSVTIPQQYADKLTATLINVDAAYPS